MLFCPPLCYACARPSPSTVAVYSWIPWPQYHQKHPGITRLSDTPLLSVIAKGLAVISASVGKAQREEKFLLPPPLP